MGNITPGYSIRAIDDRTNPVPLLFIPKPNISDVRSDEEVFKHFEINHPNENALIHNKEVMITIKIRKSQSGF